MSTGSPFSVEEYCASLPSPIPPVNTKSCEEFLVEEYDYNDYKDNEGNANETSKNIEGQAHNNIIVSNVVTPILGQGNQSASPMQIRIIPCRIRRERFNMVTSYKQFEFDVKKTCCACGCMYMVRKETLREKLLQAKL